MPTKTIKLTPQGKNDLRLSWSDSRKKIAIYWENTLVTTLQQPRPITEWQKVTLPTGDTLSIRFMKDMGRNELQIRLNEQNLTLIDLQKASETSSSMAFWMPALAAMHLLLAFKITVFPTGTVAQVLPLAQITTLAIATIYIGLIGLHRRHARAALLAACFVYILDFFYLPWLSFQRQISHLPLEFLCILGLIDAIQTLWNLGLPRYDINKTASEQQKLIALNEANSAHFWQHLDTLVATSQIIIDRPAGTVHPRYPELIYPLDYGYVQATTSPDGDGIDVWSGSLPEKRVVAVICTVDMHKRDSEIKLLLGCTPAECERILAHHNRGIQAGLLISRPMMV